MNCRFLIPVIILCSLITSELQGQSVRDSLQAGKVYEDLQSISDPDKSYAVYLPRDYDGKKLLPVVFLMDPRGAAMTPLGLFKDIADSLGYVLVSSYDTRSDTDPQVTINALNTMLQDVLNNLYVALDRIYLAGFSGTARLSWDFAFELPDNVAGIISIGAGTGQGTTFESLSKNQEKSFAYFGSAGFYDFNYFEMLWADRKLEEYGFDYQIRFFEGGHQWPPVEVVEEALSFMHLDAMNKGKAPVEPDLIEKACKIQSGIADQIRGKDDPYRLWRHQAAMIRNFDEDLLPLEIRETQQELSKELEREGDLELMDKLIEDYFTFVQFMYGQFSEFSKTEKPPEASVFAEILRINELKESQQSADHLYKKRQSRIFLELLMVQTAFYQTNTYLRSGQLNHAKTMIEIAAMIRKDRSVCRQQFRVYSALGDEAKVQESRECLEGR